MGYNEKVLEKISTMEQRSDKRKSLWQGIIQSFEQEGADGVADVLASQIGKIQERFDALLEKLDEMA
jgi:hypothetical protein